MAEYRAKGLFEAMQASKGPAQRPAAPVAPVAPRPPPASGASSGPRIAGFPGGADSGRARIATGRLVLMAAIVIVVAFGLIWGGKALLRDRDGASERDKPIAVTATVPPVEEHPAEPSVPAVAAEPPANTAAPSQGRPGGVLPPTGERPAVGTSAGGPLRIQVFSAPVANHEETEKERRKLEAAGIETSVEHSGSRYYVYTAETFATAEGEETVAALKKLKALGYGSAFAIRKHGANR